MAAIMDGAQKDYLDHHGLLKFVAEMLGNVLATKPEDPSKYMAEYVVYQRQHRGIPRPGARGGLPETAADVDAMLSQAVAAGTSAAGLPETAADVDAMLSQAVAA